jgi:hypothetical protein
MIFMQRFKAIADGTEINIVVSLLLGLYINNDSGYNRG